MAKPIKFDESGDSQDLQALFDTIAAAPAAVAHVSEPNSFGDSDDLQSLFDSVSDQVSGSAATTAPAVESGAGGVVTQEATYNRLGHMVRKLHDSMRELGYDKGLEETARKIPDARERLAYITQMTEQAASRVLNATDIAIPVQTELEHHTRQMGARWDKMFANQLSVDEFKALAADTRVFFAVAPSKIDITNAQLREIMMAQDFQDLTGQVIKKVVDLVQGVETQLLQVLIEVMPEEKKAEAPASLMNGPVVNAAGRTDIVTSQAQVDDLLESLGF
ncbi:MAG: protein phosphatase CheZ [Gammaproteobacteria bacterium]|nr:protein phosphatase CheZ [Rhodocyclaceae bacterium]MBU3910476.1 protein phosphatase CheZ [Gammaproteobacteria bacterium]MBU3990780.1 protein phosphatase CheZ [Gammaproteobacteria bacterium]MBU4004957.1 protein phosphatase CheZ [Gammaproteobacteria bacterium]MBU4020550.1 protein phosphatase CheZ [Gammaproteobacteria bacterium]